MESFERCDPGRPMEDMFARPRGRAGNPHHLRRDGIGVCWRIRPKFRTMLAIQSPARHLQVVVYSLATLPAEL